MGGRQIGFMLRCGQEDKSRIYWRWFSLKVKKKKKNQSLERRNSAFCLKRTLYAISGDTAAILWPGGKMHQCHNGKKEWPETQPWNLMEESSILWKASSYTGRAALSYQSQWAMISLLWFSAIFLFGAGDSGYLEKVYVFPPLIISPYHSSSFLFADFLMSSTTLQS